MARIARFEDIEAWQSARVLVRLVYAACSSTALRRDFGLRDQLQRAAVSSMSNVAEGFERNSTKEFRHYLHIAKASAGEVRSLLYVAADLGYIDAQLHEALSLQSMTVSRKIGGLIKYLDSRTI